jgi:signal transduction histidine kinase
LTVTRDELAVAFENTMRLEEIEEFNATLQQNIHDATSKLRASNKKLQHLDESKDEFISMASHQLRTPLTSIKGYISMVLDGDMGEITPQQRKVLEEAFASSQRMVYLIGDFLNVSRIQTGKFMLEKSRVQLANIIKDEIQQLKDTAAARHITLAYTAPTNFPELELDENKIRQVMMNFIDNAIYYSPEDTTITVSIVKHPHDIIFKVDDQGIGVPKEEQHQLFTKFYRASNARKQRPDGTGIGLFMAKKVIVAHGGSIIFETREGKGSTFGFRLPLTAVTAQSEPARTEAIAQQV